MKDGVKTAEEMEKELAKVPDPADVEDLSGVDMSMPTKSKIDLMAEERWNLVVGFNRIAAHLEMSRLSLAANESVGNKEAADKFRKEQGELIFSLASLKRAVKYIDKDFPAAKAVMLKKAVAATGG